MIGTRLQKPIQENYLPVFEDLPIFETVVIFEDKTYTEELIKVDDNGKPILDEQGNFIRITQTFTEKVPKLDENGQIVTEEIPVLDGNGKQKTERHQVGREVNKAPNTLAKYEELANWCNEHNAEIKDFGAYYEAVAIPEPSQEEKQAKLQKQLTDAVQHVLDAKAQELNYDSCLSVCSYIDTGVPKFDAEGRAFRAWRSAVWAKGYEILAQVQSGQRAIPTEAELISELPKLVINY